MGFLLKQTESKVKDKRAVAQIILAKVIRLIYKDCKDNN